MLCAAGAVWAGLSIMLGAGCCAVSGVLCSVSSVVEVSSAATSVGIGSKASVHRHRLGMIFVSKVKVIAKLSGNPVRVQV